MSEARHSFCPPAGAAGLSERTGPEHWCAKQHAGVSEESSGAYLASRLLPAPPMLSRTKGRERQPCAGPQPGLHWVPLPASSRYALVCSPSLSLPLPLFHKQDCFHGFFANYKTILCSGMKEKFVTKHVTHRQCDWLAVNFSQ